MKNKKLFLIIPLLFLVMGMGGCNDEDDKSLNCDCLTEKEIEIVDMTGVILFNEDLKSWCISVHTEGTYDEVGIYVPCNLEKSYKTKNRNIVFSGKASNLQIGTIPAGASYFCLEISSISAIN